jgi:sugar phosphate isomerase/epimerase
MMKLSLSTRVAEAPKRKDLALLDLPQIAKIARDNGYTALSMRASQVGIQSSDEQRRAARAVIDEVGLHVSMVTGDYDIPANTERLVVPLREIDRHLDLAQALGADLVRVAVKADTQIPHLQRACDAAAQRGMRLAHQCHVATLFETVDRSLEVVREVGRENFGITYEPSNLLVCGQDYGIATLRRLAPHLFNVYLQNLAPRVGAPNVIETWVHGPIEYDLVPFGDPRGIDLRRVFDGLQAVGYAGYVTVHQNVANGSGIADGARACAQYLRTLASFE